MGAPGCPNPQHRGYKTYDKAKRIEWKLLRKGIIEDWKYLHAYKCQCGLYHVGHNKGETYGTTDSQ